MGASLEESRLQVKAVFDFKGGNNDELCLEKGDILVLTQTPDGGWWEGTLRGLTGWFPSNYVSQLDHSDVIATEHSHAIEQFDSLPPDETTVEYRNMVYKEVLDSESAYVKQLDQTLSEYLIPLQNARILDEIETGLIVERFHQVAAAHRQFLQALERLRTVAHKDQRIGGIFMEFAASVKSSHSNYCALHPKFIHTIEEAKDEICDFIKAITDPPKPAGSVLLASSVSNSFRRLDKYPALLQELQRYTDEAHPDRGDIQRAGFIYRDMVTDCLQLRRQKEMELEVMLGNVKNWPNTEEPISTLGPAIHMGPLGVQAVGLNEDGAAIELKKDRYLVIFPQHLLILSVSAEMTSFVFERKLALAKVTLPRTPDPGSLRTTFEVLLTGEASAAAGKYVFHCNKPEEVLKWITMMHQCKAHQARIKGHQTPSMGNSDHKSPSRRGPSGAGHKQVQSPSRTKYYASKSLLPHSPLRSSVLGNANTTTPVKAHHGSAASSAASTMNSSSCSRLKPDEDMAILQVIEAYYLSGRRQKQASSGHFESPSVILADEEKIIVEKKSGGGETRFEERSLVDTVYGIQEELKGVREEVNALNDSLKHEKKERKKLRALLDLIIRRLDVDA